MLSKARALPFESVRGPWSPDDRGPQRTVGHGPQRTVVPRGPWSPDDLGPQTPYLLYCGPALLVQLIYSTADWSKVCCRNTTYLKYTVQYLPMV